MAVAFGRRHIQDTENTCTYQTITTTQLLIIIIMKRKDLGGVMSKDCKDTLQTLKTVTKRECEAK